MSAPRPLYQPAGRGGLCACCSHPIRRGSYEYREINYGRRFRYHPECARKSVLSVRLGGAR